MTWSAPPLGRATRHTASGSGETSPTWSISGRVERHLPPSCTPSGLAASGSSRQLPGGDGPERRDRRRPGTAHHPTDTDTILVLGAEVSGTKTVAGPRLVGTTATYTVVLSNAGPGDQPDNPGAEFTDVLPSGLALVSRDASTNTAVTPRLE
ncbi:MAG: DUF11 domain-containing protein [Holophagales bacterium]|nr:DUF11 domain-containing protein [Holophagales bacterium]